MTKQSEARERILQAAERLFVQRGYDAVTVKDIAKAIGKHHATLYHHIPQGGKEALFIEVMEAALERHRAAIQQAIERGGDDLRAQLLGIAGWLLSQPPLDMIRMVNSDMPSMKSEAAEHLANLAYEAVLLPIEACMRAAAARGEIAHPNIGTIAGALFSAIEGFHALPDEYIDTSRLEMATDTIDVFIRGMGGQ